MSLYDQALTTVTQNTVREAIEINKAALAKAIWAEQQIARWDDDQETASSIKHGEIRNAAGYRDASISILTVGTGIPFQSWLDTVRAIALEETTS